MGWTARPLATGSEHLTLTSAGSPTLCGAPSHGVDLSAAFTDLSDAAVRDRVCRACLREWLAGFAGQDRPVWAAELQISA